MEAIAICDYTAKDRGEISLKKGDIIKDVEAVDEIWYDGITIIADGSRKRGHFPREFVEISSNSIQEQKKGKKKPDVVKSVAGKKCKVLFAYQPVNEDELELHENDVIDVISEIEEGWWKGTLNNKVGVFPSNFVMLIETPPFKVQPQPNHLKILKGGEHAEHSGSNLSAASSDVPSLPPKPAKEVCVALFPYEGKNLDELTLRENDTIVLISKETSDKGWWKGMLNGKIGVFPDNFVKLVSVTTDTASPKLKRPLPVLDNGKIRANDSITAAFRTSLESDSALSGELLKKGSSVSVVSVAKKQFGGDNVHPGTTSIKIGGDKLSGKDALDAGTDVSSSNRDKHYKAKSSSIVLMPGGNNYNGSKIGFVSNVKNAIESTGKDKPDGSVASKKQQRPIDNRTPNFPPDKSDDLNIIGRCGIGLSHPTAYRVKAPSGRRPPSNVNQESKMDGKIKEVPLKTKGTSVIKEKFSKTSNMGIYEGISTKDASSNLVKGFIFDKFVKEGDFRAVERTGSNSSVELGTKHNNNNNNSKTEGDLLRKACGMKKQASSFVSRGNGVTFHPPTQQAIPHLETTTCDTSAVISVTASEWKFLNERVEKLEARVEFQYDLIRGIVDRLTSHVTSEKEQMHLVKSEIDDLAHKISRL